MSEMVRNNKRTGLEIAVIGMAGRFPAAKNIDEFRDNLKNGVESISFFPDRELEEAGIDPGFFKKDNYVKAKGVLADIEYFDYTFFDYTRKEAEWMDPQFRILHECCWHALEDAGYAPDTYDGAIGLYVGTLANYQWVSGLVSHLDEPSEQIATGSLNDRDFLSTRVAYKLNLKGPAITVQTACSTSLLAIHLGCQGLLSGESDMVLAGGVSLWLPGKSGYLYEEGMVRSSDGHCRAFDAKANGTNGGDGAAVVVLKRLEDALAAGDRIDALVKGSAVNNDGRRKVGYTAPSVEGQVEVIGAALQMAEVEAESITYIEAHGTATILGDPIEVEALKQVFQTDKRQFCAIGSVKTNVGHLDAAAGAAGFIKAVLALKYRLIPPSLHFETPNPRIDFENSPFYVNTRLREWESSGFPLRAGVSSFGIGGTNVHVILEEWPQAQSAERKAHSETRVEYGAVSQGRGGVSPPHQLILLSAQTEVALERMTQNLVEHLKKNPGVNLADAAYTLQVGRKAFKYRRCPVGNRVDDLIDTLSSPGLQTFCSEGDQRPVVFMFSGQGSQYLDMGRELYETGTVFREEIDRCFEILKPLLVYDLKGILYPGDLVSRGGSPCPPSPGNSPLERGTPDPRKGGGVFINQTEIAQPLLFAFEYALAQLLMKWGIRPYAMIGHSIGEYTAACLSGGFSLEEALELVVLRGKLMQKMPVGAMLSVNISEDELHFLLDSYEEISLAAVNGPWFCVVSGPHHAVDAFAKDLTAKGYQVRRLHTSHAFHSNMMDPILPEFEHRVGGIRLKEPQMPYISNISGNWITLQEAGDPGYWARQLRETVRFGKGLEELFKTKNAVFVEVGPGRALSTLVNKHPQKNPGHGVVNLIGHAQENIPADRYLLERLGRLWAFGVSVDWTGFYQDWPQRRLSLPPYPFERHRHWKYGEPLTKINTRTAAGKGLDKNEKKAVADWFYIPSWKRSLPPMPGADAAPCRDPILVFMHDEQPVPGWVNRLAQTYPYMVTAKTGESFTRVSAQEYILDPDAPPDYDRLIAQLETNGQIPFKMIHFWGVTGNNRVRKDLRDFYRLVYLLRALGKHHFSEPFQISVVTDNMQEITGDEPLDPWKAAVLGPLKVVPQEYPNISCRSIDVLLPEPGTPGEEKLTGLLLTELTADSRDRDMEPMIALRGSFRWVQCFEPVQPGTPGGQRLRDRGVYLISGGLGHIGSILAKHLAQTVNARLILTGRSPLSPGDEWERKKQEIEALGGEVLVLTADAGDREQMQTAITRAEERFGPLNGVIHAAGVISGPSIKGIRDLRPMDCQEQFRPKVEGLEILNSLLQGKNLDFCFLVSSLSSILGGLGFTAYSAANLFMDAFAQKANRENPIPWISVNWDTWQSKADTLPALPASPGEGITPEEGVRAFHQVLSHRFATRMVVSTRDLSARINQWIKRQYLHESDTLARSRAPDQDMVSFNQTERSIAQLCRHFFGIEHVGGGDHFFDDMGAASLDIIRLNRKLKEILNRDIPVERWFEYPTIDSLAEYLDSSAPTPEPMKPTERSSPRAEKAFKLTRRKKHD